ncbi:MAG: SRPBCC family protein [Tannerellaceae bacterium]|nr:SRPBCC family protein [Tannerellaceae bacterium]
MKVKNTNNKICLYMYMENNILAVKAALQIGKPADQVFEAIINPEKMKNYFISESSGRMEEGKTIIWRFPEFDMEIPVRVGIITQDKFISFCWDGSDNQELLVEISLESQANNSTVVRITEGSMENNDAGIAWLVSNTEGWAGFLACLKAYLEYGINLRKGAYDFMKKV